MDSAETLLVYAFGTRGDVEPLSALAAGWADEDPRRQVVFVTQDRHVRSSWLRRVLEEEDDEYGCRVKLIGVPSMASSTEEEEYLNEAREAACVDAAVRTSGDRAVLFNLKSFEGLHIADAIDAPCAAAHPSPAPGGAPFDVARRLSTLEPSLREDRHLLRAATVWLWPALLSEHWLNFRRRAFTHLASWPVARQRGEDASKLRRRPTLLVGSCADLEPRMDRVDANDSVVITGDWVVRHRIRPHPDRQGVLVTLGSAGVAPFGALTEDVAKRFYASIAAYFAHGERRLFLQADSFGFAERFFPMMTLSTSAATTSAATTSATSSSATNRTTTNDDNSRRQQQQRRGVVGSGGGPAYKRPRRLAECYPPFVTAIRPEDADHDQLMSMCVCVIHHGGAGTCHRAARSNCSQVVIPFCEDHRARGFLLQTSLRVGASVDLYVDRRPDALREALDVALHPDTLQRAAALGKRIRDSNDGVKSALRVLGRVADESAYDDDDDEEEENSENDDDDEEDEEEEENSENEEDDDDDSSSEGEPISKNNMSKKTSSKNVVGVVVEDREEDGKTGSAAAAAAAAGKSDDEEARLRSSSADDDSLQNNVSDGFHRVKRRRRERSARVSSSLSRKKKKRRHGDEVSLFSAVEGHRLTTLGRVHCRVYAPFDTSEAEAIAHRIFRLKAYDALFKYVKKGARRGKEGIVVVDAGAHIGLFTVAAMLATPDREATFVAIEPQPTSATALLANVERYATSERWTTKVVTSALGADTTEADLAWRDDAPANATILPSTSSFFDSSSSSSSSGKKKKNVKGHPSGRRRTTTTRGPPPLFSSLGEEEEKKGTTTTTTTTRQEEEEEEEEEEEPRRRRRRHQQDSSSSLRRTTVRVRPLHCVLRELGLPRRRLLLKVSVEGSEVDVLKGAVPVLGDVVALVVECQSRDVADGDVTDILKPLGFHLSVEPARGRPDGAFLVVAHRDLDDDDDRPDDLDDDDRPALYHPKQRHHTQWQRSHENVYAARRKRRRRIHVDRREPDVLREDDDEEEQDDDEFGLYYT
eukprot:CAMPEP_0118894656 /NCGR_PEP_ID=MMETSP1166-20130328/3342_1 /TAXON_ID=1104430 /ORGANISM="Chrysoreinhardia sp, Strain CCMP3193" /LENGTH=1042 /DNA_ID=CAMNT_0006833595 /DNA_START=53 /DNA_END=3181 /DNA_ORIENTATION=+